MWSRIDAKLKLCLLAVVDGEALHEERGEPGAGAATEGMEQEEALSRDDFLDSYMESYTGAQMGKLYACIKL